MNMKKRILSFLLTVAMVLTLLVAIPAVTISADTTVNVGSKAELAAIATAVNDGTDDYAGKTVVLTADLDLSGSNWTSIGTSGNPFRGSFDGNGHTISGMTRSGGAIGGNVGLFGCVSSPDGGSVTIQNFKISGSIASSNGGENAGTVISMVKPSATGTTEVNILGVWSTVNFDASAAKMTGVGGILGTISWLTGDYEITVNIDSCRYSGTLDSPSAGSNDYGGIMGYPKEAASPRSVNISNCLFDGILSLCGSAPDDNGGIVGYFKGNGGNSRQTNIHIDDCIVAGQFRHPNKSSVTVTGYVTSEASGSNTDYQVNNVYYCNDADRHTGGDLGGWYGYYKQGDGAISSLITYSNVTAKTMTEIKALSSGFSDNSKWHFGTSSELPVPAMIYDNIISNANPYENTSADEYEISSADELMQFAAGVNSGANTFAGKTVLLTDDIEVGSDWVSIGSRTGGNTGKLFRGTFDGQGHKITFAGHTVSSSLTGALFGYLGDGAVVKDLELTGTITTSGAVNFLGTLANAVVMNVSVRNVHSDVRINAGGNLLYSGGLIGFMENGTFATNLTIDGCVYNGVINCGGQAKAIGGFVGYTGNIGNANKSLTITNSGWNGTITLNDPAYSTGIGGFVGYQPGGNTNYTRITITDCVAAGNFTFNKSGDRDWTGSQRILGTVIGASCIDVSGGVITNDAKANCPIVLTNVYYRAIKDWTGENDIPYNTMHSSPKTAPIITNVVSKTVDELAALTAGTVGFSDLSAWKFTANTSYGKYFPCPVSFDASVMAIIQNCVVDADYRNTLTNSGIRFTATFCRTELAENGGTLDANFGLILITKANYNGESTLSDLVAAGGVYIKATRYKTVDGNYTVSAVVCNIPAEYRDVEIVAIAYLGNVLSDPCIATYNGVAN